MASRSKRQQALADTFNLPPTTKKKDRTQQVLTDTTNNTSQSFDSNEKEHAGFNGFNSVCSDSNFGFCSYLMYFMDFYIIKFF